jgi:hypothetical protein
MVRRNAARDALTLLELARRPVGGLLPVNTARAADRLGITLVAGELDPDVAVRLVKRAGHDPQITSNQADGTRRRQVAYAHALGHFYGRRDDVDEYEFEDRRAVLIDDGGDDEEAYANEFGASLLMPERLVHEMVLQGHDEITMASRFFVPRDVMHHRLDRLGLR